MITIELVLEMAESFGWTKRQFEDLYEDVVDRWGDYSPLHLPSFMLGQIEMQVSTVKAYKQAPEAMLAILESHRQ